MDNAAGDIRQSKIPPGVAIGQALMIQSQLMQDRGVQVVHVDLIVNRLTAELVCFAISESGSNSSTCQPDGEPARVMIASGPRLFGIGCPSKLATPPDDRIFEQPSPLEICQ